MSKFLQFSYFITIEMLIGVQQTIHSEPLHLH